MGKTAENRPPLKIRLCLHTISFGLALFLASRAGAYSSESAVRLENESFESALDRYLAAHAEATRASGTAIKRARLYRPGVDVSILPAWIGSDDTLELMMFDARDERMYHESRRPGFARRAPWLYPDNGCYARAAHLAREFTRQGFPRPGQIFAFGKLRMRTKFKKKKVARWWYHVSAAYRIGDETVVLDPAVEPRHPLRLEEWLRRFSRNPRSVKISICDSNAYAPRSRCEGGSRVSDAEAISDLKRLLPLEWNRLKSLRMNPERLLGDAPPW